MQNCLKVVFVCLLLLAGRQTTQAQSIADADKHLSDLLEKLDYWHIYGRNDNKISPEDSLSALDDKLTDYLKKVCEKNPQTIKGQYPKAIKAGLTAISAGDNMVCAYSWDTYQGGTMRDYSDYLQYKGAKGIHMKCMNCGEVEGGDYGVYYEAITTVHTTSNKTFYFILGTAVGSTKDRAEVISAYEIQGDSLKAANVFKTKTKNLNTISYGYDMFASSGGNEDIAHIHFGKDNKRLYIPIVAGEKVTARYLVYVFDGERFVFDKDAK